MNPAPIPPFLDREKSDACIHCGLCLQACPTFLETGNENDSPRGRIHLMRGLDDGRFPLTNGIANHIDRCLGCRACEAVCPSGVEYGAMIERTREIIRQHRTMPLPKRLLQRVVVERLLISPTALRLSTVSARWMQRIGGMALLPQRLRAMAALLPPKSSNNTAEKITRQGVREKKIATGIMGGCVASVLFPETNRATISAAQACGYQITADSGSACCGAIHAHSGNMEQARTRTQAMIVFFERAEVDVVLVNAAGCGSAMKEYPQLFNGNPQWHARAEQFSSKVRDVTEILHELPDDFNKKATNHPRTTYHDACHLCHAQNIAEQPRTLLRSILGENFVELPEADICCGSAGSYNITQPELAQRLGARKAKNILATEATVVVAANIGCIMQIRASLSAAGASGVRVVHIADWVMEFGQ